MRTAVRPSVYCNRRNKSITPARPYACAYVTKNNELGLHRFDRTPVFCVGSLVRDGDAPSSVLGAARPSSRCSALGLRAALAPAGSPWKDFFPPGWRPCERCGGRAAELAKSTWFQSCEATVSVHRNFSKYYIYTYGRVTKLICVTVGVAAY